MPECETVVVVVVVRTVDAMPSVIPLRYYYYYYYSHWVEEAPKWKPELPVGEPPVVAVDNDVVRMVVVVVAAE